MKTQNCSQVSAPALGAACAPRYTGALRRVNPSCPSGGWAVGMQFWWSTHAGPTSEPAETRVVAPVLCGRGDRLRRSRSVGSSPTRVG